MKFEKVVLPSLFLSPLYIEVGEKYTSLEESIAENRLVFVWAMGVLDGLNGSLGGYFHFRLINWSNQSRRTATRVTNYSSNSKYILIVGR